jgi:outer membrane protein assembly factor BamB
VFATTRAKVLAGLTAVVVLALGAFVIYQLVKPASDVDEGDQVEFEAQPKPKATPKKRGDRFRWPMYGLDRRHTRYLPSTIRPPFKRRWSYSAKATVEISPNLVGGVLYLQNKHATVSAVSARTGKRTWQRYLGNLSASSPTYSRGRLFVTTLSKDAYALSVRKKGKTAWHRSLPSRSESTPIVVGRNVIFGSEDGTVYSLGWKTGRTRWKHHARGAVKGALAYWRGRVYYGTYGGQVVALNARTGRVSWRATQNGLALGRAGNFYATPTVAFGRVYIGNTDGRVYSFSAKTGRLAWSHSTGNYVYAAAAAADTPKTRPTVYVGSFDGRFYALDAKRGQVKWSFPAGSSISGAPTVIGSIVYFSGLRNNKTFGLDIRNGHKAFAFPRGDYNPAIADDHGNLYLTAVNRVYKLTSRKFLRKQKAAAAKTKAAAQKKKAKEKG